RAQDLLRHRAGRHAPDRLAGAGAAPALPVADAVFGLVRVVGVAGPVLILEVCVGGGPRIGIPDQDRDRTAERLPLEDAGEDLALILLLPRRRDPALPRPPAVQFLLNICLTQLQPRRAAVD